MDEERKDTICRDVYLVGEKGCGCYVSLLEERCHPVGSCVNGRVGEPGVDIRQLQGRINKDKIGTWSRSTYSIVNGFQDFVVEVTSGIGIAHRDGLWKVHRSNLCPGVIDVGDKNGGTC
jgi:hypothetical protein